MITKKNKPGKQGNLLAFFTLILLFCFGLASCGSITPLPPDETAIPTSDYSQALFSDKFIFITVDYAVDCTLACGCLIFEYLPEKVHYKGGILTLLVGHLKTSDIWKVSRRSNKGIILYSFYSPGYTNLILITKTPATLSNKFLKFEIESIDSNGMVTFGIEGEKIALEPSNTYKWKTFYKNLDCYETNYYTLSNYGFIYDDHVIVK
jgi:hypothetical protein